MSRYVTGAATRAAGLLRIAFGLVWAIDASFKWTSSFRSEFAHTVTSAVTGQPGWLRPWFSLWSNLPHSQAMVLAYGTAITETFLAVMLLAGCARILTYVVGAGYSLLVWAIPEGFGGPYGAGSTDIGTGIIYTFVFVGLLVLASHSGPDPYSLDFYLEPRVSWWWRLVEWPSKRAITPRGSHAIEAWGANHTAEVASASTDQGAVLARPTAPSAVPLASSPPEQ